MTKVIIDSMANVPLKGIREVDLLLLQRRLTIIPKATSFDPNPDPIVLYKKGLQSIAIPREYYFQTTQGIHEIEYQVSEGAPMKELPRVRLRHPQIPVVLDVIRHLQGGKSLGGILNAETGFGKCLRKGTEVLMYDGQLKKVEQVEIGDLLMGPDSTPRRVLSLGHGRSKMYKVIPRKGDPWWCNEDHILSLKKATAKTLSESKEIFDIPVKKFAENQWHYCTNYRQFRVAVEFVKKDLDFDPYKLGVGLVDTIRWGAKILPLSEHQVIDDYLINKGITQENKHIPFDFKTSCRVDRMNLLAGLIDGHGSVENNYLYKLIARSDRFKDDIVFLARSLGFLAKATKRVKAKSHTYDELVYWRISISGHIDQIPCRREAMKLKNFERIHDPLQTSIHIEVDGEDDYYGFVIDGDHRYLLSDFTVTHNTISGLEIARRLGRATLIKVYKDSLADQWLERIKAFFPDAKIGRIQGDVCHYEGCDFVIAMIQTLVSRKGQIQRNQKLVNYFGLEISDEVHRLGSKDWGSVADLFPCKYRLGLSATVRRKDNCETVFKYHIGEIVAVGKGVALEPDIYFKDTSFRPKDQGRFNNMPAQLQLKIMSKDVKRNKGIAHDILLALIAGRKIIVLSKFTEHLQELENITSAMIHLRAEDPKFSQLKSKTLGLYVGSIYTGEKRQNRKGEMVPVKILQTKKDLEKAAKSDCLFATYKMAEDALDIPQLDTLFMALPISDPEQACGRILRIHETKKKPLVVDICDDNVSFCRGLQTARVRIYQSKGWKLKIGTTPKEGKSANQTR